MTPEAKKNLTSKKQKTNKHLICFLVPLGAPAIDSGAICNDCCSKNQPWKPIRKPFRDPFFIFCLWKLLLLLWVLFFVAPGVVPDNLLHGPKNRLRLRVISYAFDQI